MKKLFIAFVALVASLSFQKADAQLLDFDGMPPYRLGVFGGLNIPTFSSNSYNPLAGAHAGLDMMVSAGAFESSMSDLFVRLDVEYTMKEAKGPDPTTGKKMNIRTHSLEIPLHVGYGWALTDNFSLLAETGPYFAFGLGGKAHPAGLISKDEDKPVFKSSGYDAQHFDFGWGARAGILFHQVIELYAGYEWGLINVTPTFLQNRNFRTGLVLYFDYK